MTDIDVAVIGAGPGGYVAAIRAGQQGLKTVLIEEGEIGGVCLNIGCIPSKAFIAAGKEFAAAEHGARKGLHFASGSVNMAELVAFKDGVVKKLTGGVSGLLKAAGVEVIKGRATVTGPTSIKVGSRTITAKNIIVATGSSTIEIPGFPFDEKRVLSSTGVLRLNEVPKNLVVIGGGVIGLELACAMNNLGCKQVTVIEMMDQLLPGMDLDMAKGLQKILERRGFTIQLQARAHGAKPSQTGVDVTYEVAGKSHTIKASHCLVSVGRRPNSRGIGLTEAGVKLDERGFIPTDAQGRSSVRTIFAIGDVTHGPMLAHKASKEGIVAAECAAGSKGAAKDWVTIPGVVYTDPEIATAGLTEAQAKAQGFTVKLGKFQVGALGKAMADGETDGFYKVIGDAKTDRLLGVHIMAPHASDLISEAVVALEMAATVADLGMAVHPHPTLSEGVMEAAEALHGKAIHAINRS